LRIVGTDFEQLVPGLCCALAVVPLLPEQAALDQRLVNVVLRKTGLAE